MAYDWGGGLVWVATACSEPAAAAIRRAVSSASGHATLMRAPDALRAAVEVFEPPSALALAAEPRAQAKLRSGRRTEFRPHVRGRVRISVQTNFSAEALADPHTRELEGILRSCVHCGFCTATCPTYVTRGDERDSPRGRIYLIKDLLETGRKITAEDVWPIDHCLQLPLLHDDLPFGRRLSSPRRSCAGSDPRNLPPSVRRPPHARRPRAPHCVEAGLSRRVAARGGRTLLAPRSKAPARDWAEARCDAGACARNPFPRRA